MVFPANVVVPPPAARIAAGLLRAFARGSLLWMGAAMLFNEPLQKNTLAQIRMFTGLFLVPEVAAWCVMRAFAAQMSLEGGALVLTSGTRRMSLALRDIVLVEPWRVPIRPLAHCCVWRLASAGATAWCWPTPSPWLRHWLALVARRCGSAPPHARHCMPTHAWPSGAAGWTNRG